MRDTLSILSFLQHKHITNYLSLFSTRHTCHQSSLSLSCKTYISPIISLSSLQHIHITNHLSFFEYIYHHYIFLSIIHIISINTYYSHIISLSPHIIITHHLSYKHIYILLISSLSSYNLNILPILLSLSSTT